MGEFVAGTVPRLSDHLHPCGNLEQRQRQRQWLRLGRRRFGALGGSAGGSASGSAGSAVTLAQIRLIGMPGPFFEAPLFNMNTDTTAEAVMLRQTAMGVGIMMPLGIGGGGFGGGGGALGMGGGGLGGGGLGGGGLGGGGMGGMGGMGMGGGGMRGGGGMGGFAGKGMGGFNGRKAL